MNENFWDLRDVDPETRRRAIEEAERLGLSLADYLTEILMSDADIEQPALASADAAPQPPDDIADPLATDFRHRLELLERRWRQATGVFESSVHALDSSIDDLAARVDDTEALTRDTSDTIARALHDIRSAVSTLRERVNDAEIAADEHKTAHASSRAKLERRVTQNEADVRAFDAAIAAFAHEHDALKHAVAEDFSVLALQTTARLNVELQDIRRAAEAAAEQADTAIAELVREMRNAREGLEEQLAGAVLETRGCVQAVRGELGSQASRLDQRIDANAAHTADVERGLQDGVLALSAALRRTDEALSAESARLERDQKAAIAALRAQVDSLQTDREVNAARITLVDAALSNTIDEVARVGERFEARFAEENARSQRVQSEWNARLDTIVARAARGELEATQSRELLATDIARVEACTLASLKKLSDDIASVRANTDTTVGAARAKLEAELAALRDQHAGVLAKLKSLDATVAAMDAGAAPLNQRLVRVEAEAAALRGVDQRLGTLEAAHASADTARSLAAARSQLAALESQVRDIANDERLAKHAEELDARVAAQEAHASETSTAIQDLTRMLERLTVQNSDAGKRSEDRLHRLELDAAEQRLAGSTASAEISKVEQRLAELEERRAEGIDALHAEVARFTGENDRRLALLESTAVHIDDARAFAERLAQIETRDVALEFEALRKRIEDRVQGLEARSVLALEQISETIAVLERRMAHDQDAVARSA